MLAHARILLHWHRALWGCILAGGVLGVMAAVLHPSVMCFQYGRTSRVKGDVSQIALSIARMRTDTGVTSAACLTNLSNLPLQTAPVACQPVDKSGAPTTLKSCEEVSLTAGEVCWGGPYMTTVLPDPWQHPYQVELGPEDAITVRSFGPNRRIDRGDGDDISYVQ